MKNKVLVGFVLMTVVLIPKGVLPNLSHKEVQELRSRYDFVPGQLLVRFKSERNPSEIKILQERTGVEVSQVGRNLGIHLLKFPLRVSRKEAKDLFQVGERKKLEALIVEEWNHTKEMIEVYEKSGLVEWVEPNRVAHISYNPNDPYYRDASGFPNTGTPDQYGLFNISAAAGWDLEQGGDPTILLAIIDSGTDLDHPDLAANIWINSGETPGNSIDDDGNGYIDDVNGYDFVGGNIGSDPWNPEDPNQEDPNPDVHTGNDGWGAPDPSVGNGIDDALFILPDKGVGHGTHTAGIAGAVMDNDTFFAGLAGHVSLVIVRAMNAEGAGFYSDIAAAIEYAGIIGADVISMSLGGSTDDPALRTAIQNAHAAGSAIFAASGNSGIEEILYPAGYPEVLAIGSFNESDLRTSFSTYGSHLDVVAPGGETSPVEEAIWSTYVISFYEAESLGLGPMGSPDIRGAEGTSMACPHAAALGALVRSIQPGLSNDSVYQLIRNGAVDLQTPGFDNETGWGKINVFNTLSFLVGVEEKTNYQLPITSYQLLQIQPNPFQSRTTFHYQIPDKGHVSLKVYDLTGQLVETLLDSPQEAGSYKVMWDGRTPESGARSGIYFIQFAFGEEILTRKFILVR